MWIFFIELRKKLNFYQASGIPKVNITITVFLITRTNLITFQNILNRLNGRSYIGHWKVDPICFDMGYIREKKERKTKKELT